MSTFAPLQVAERVMRSAEPEFAWPTEPPKSATGTKAVHARAFTVGHDLFFRRAEFEPNTRTGRQLVAHELAHVVQQSSGGPRGASVRPAVQRQAGAGVSEPIRDAGLPGSVADPGIEVGDTGTISQTPTAAAESGTGFCDDTTAAWDAWCVPFTDIRVCSPNYFRRDDTRRSTTLIHEWVHRYGCNFDLGYEGSDEFSGSGTGRALFNADPWAKLVRDVQ